MPDRDPTSRMPKYFLDLTLKHIEDIYGFQKMKFAQNMPEGNYTSTVSLELNFLKPLLSKFMSTN